jgi:hypothetical protein
MIRKLERLAAAVAFAEANDAQTALELLDEIKGRYPQHSRKIVLVSPAEPIKQGLVEYGLGLAQRMRYHTLFMSVFPGKEKEKIFEQLAARDRDTVRNLAQRLAPAGTATMRTEHAALRGDWKTLVQEACHRLGGVEMVILQKKRSEPCHSGFAVPVFCLDL